jgi:hypothetical protein
MTWSTRTMTGDTPARSDEPDDEAWLPRLFRQVEAAFAARAADNPTRAPDPPPEPEPWVDKPGSLIAAEKGVFRIEMAAKLRGALCGGVARCKKHRCRRRRRCSDVDDLAPQIAEARARLAAEQAKWQPPPAPAAAPRRRRKR